MVLYKAFLIEAASPAESCILPAGDYISFIEGYIFFYYYINLIYINFLYSGY